MRVEALHVTNVRHLKPQKFVFAPQINELVGCNAAGKTAVLEAIHLLILGSSFRTHQLRDIVQHGQTEILIEADVNCGGVHKTLSLRYDMQRRYVTIDGQLQESSSLLLGNLLGVTATLEDQELVFGAPSVRRQFLDEQIAQIDPYYVQMLARYTKALSHRNRLLRQKSFRTIGAWEEQLALAGAYIVAQRRRTVAHLAPKVICKFEQLFEKKDAFDMRYTSSAPYDTDLSTWYQEEYRTRRHQEAQMASTLIGPHRDDLTWTLSNKPLKTVASLGQARSVSLALRFAEWELLAERSNEKPIFLIDDAESTLDTFRKQTLLELCKLPEQVFFTCHESQSSLHHVIEIKNN
jgi:DNA replication and repair protein RecF